jgi:hypothetical protein
LVITGGHTAPVDARLRLNRRIVELCRTPLSVAKIGAALARESGGSFRQVQQDARVARRGGRQVDRVEQPGMPGVERRGEQRPVQRPGRGSSHAPEPG